MTTNTITQLVAPTALSDTLTTTLYTVPASTKAIVKEVLLCNTDTVARTVTLYLGTGSATANTILSAQSLAAGETTILTLSTVLNPGEYIKGGASATSVVAITVSGVEVV
jgi:hypothetical protein